MRAVVYEEFGGPLVLREVPPPVCPPHGVVVAVAATGVCRSDWHAWRGHDGGVALPNVPGHELAGTVVEVGADVAGAYDGVRVTAPFVNACGSCASCRRGRATTCERQTQPGFTRWGSFADVVVVDHADVNLVRLPDAVDDATAASLGCRFATAHRAVAQGRVSAGEHVVVVGCGGVGLAAVMVAAARGARVTGVDPSPAARELALRCGAGAVLDPAGAAVLADDRPDVTVDALGRTAALTAAVGWLRPGGRHVQVGLLLGADASPAVDLGRVVADELELIGSHGMGAADYPAMLAEIAAGTLDPARLVGRRIRLDEAPEALASLDRSPHPGVTVAVP